MGTDDLPFRHLRVYSQKIYKHINYLFANPSYIFLYTLFVWFSYFLDNVVFYKYAVHFGLSLKDIMELFIFSTIALATIFYCFLLILYYCISFYG